MYSLGYTNWDEAEEGVFLQYPCPALTRTSEKMLFIIISQVLKGTKDEEKPKGEMRGLWILVSGE